MPLAIPPEFKAISPYIKRSEELENGDLDSKYVSYYCLLFALEKAMKVDAVDKTFLYGLFEKAEKSKVAFGISTIEDEKATICENFAMSVFQKADDEDRVAVATMKTAKTFYAAATFFDILEQFGALDEEVMEKRKYSKWRAAEIIHALKEGRRPTAPAEPESGAMDIPSAPTAMPVFQQQESVPKPALAVVPSVASSVASSASAIVAKAAAFTTGTALNKPSPSSLDGKVHDAIELSSFAIAALKYNDIPLARQRLEEALRLLSK